MTSQGMYSIVVGGSWNKVFVLYSGSVAQKAAGSKEIKCRLDPSNTAAVNKRASRAKCIKAAKDELLS